MQRFSESEATLCRECEQKAILIKELEEEKATLLKQCEQKDTLLQWCKEQMTMSFERSERQKAAFLREFEQEKVGLPKLRPYEEWRYKPSEYSMEKLNEELRRNREIIDLKVGQNPDLLEGSFCPFSCISLLTFLVGRSFKRKRSEAEVGAKLADAWTP